MVPHVMQKRGEQQKRLWTQMMSMRKEIERNVDELHKKKTKQENKWGGRRKKRTLTPWPSTLHFQDVHPILLL